jgi:hypothetical protein
LRLWCTHKKTEEGLDGVVASAVREEGLGTGRDGPAAHEERDPDIGTKLLGDQTAGQLSREEGDEEDLLLSATFSLVLFVEYIPSGHS